MSEFNEKGDTKQLLAPDLTNLSQERSYYLYSNKKYVEALYLRRDATPFCNSMKVLVQRWHNWTFTWRNSASFRDQSRIKSGLISCAYSLLQAFRKWSTVGQTSLYFGVWQAVFRLWFGILFNFTVQKISYETIVERLNLEKIL